MLCNPWFFPIVFDGLGSYWFIKLIPNAMYASTCTKNHLNKVVLNLLSLLAEVAITYKTL